MEVIWLFFFGVLFLQGVGGRVVGRFCGTDSGKVFRNFYRNHG